MMGEHDFDDKRVLTRETADRAKPWDYGLMSSSLDGLRRQVEHPSWFLKRIVEIEPWYESERFCERSSISWRYFYPVERNGKRVGILPEIPEPKDISTRVFRITGTESGFRWAKAYCEQFGVVMEEVI